jgi:hypothetical protein
MCNDRAVNGRSYDEWGTEITLFWSNEKTGLFLFCVGCQIRDSNRNLATSSADPSASGPIATSLLLSSRQGYYYRLDHRSRVPSALSRTYPSLARSIQDSLPIQNPGDNACGAVLPAPRSGPLFQALINDLEMVDQNSASWNRVSLWLRQVAGLRQAA